MRTTTKPRPTRDRHGLHAVTTTLPPIQCEPWCMTGDGHPDEWHPVDQHCCSDLPGGEVFDADGNEVALTYTNKIHGRAATVRVWTRGEQGMTVEQARRFGRAMLAAAALAEATNTGLPMRRCVDCGTAFPWDESSDDDRCALCASIAHRDDEPEAAAR